MGTVMELGIEEIAQSTRLKKATVKRILDDAGVEVHEERAVDNDPSTKAQRKGKESMDMSQKPKLDLAEVEELIRAELEPLEEKTANLKESIARARKAMEADSWKQWDGKAISLSQDRAGEASAYARRHSVSVEEARRALLEKTRPRTFPDQPYGSVPTTPDEERRQHGFAHIDIERLARESGASYRQVMQAFAKDENDKELARLAAEEEVARKAAAARLSRWHSGEEETD